MVGVVVTFDLRCTIYYSHPAQVQHIITEETEIKADKPVKHMHENPVYRLRGFLAAKLSARASEKAFNKLPAGLVDLYIGHYELLFSFKNIRQNTLETELLDILDIMAEKLNENSDILLSLINDLTNRDIQLHHTVESDTLWKLSKSYKSEMYEICEINNLGNVLKPYEKKYLLIPCKPMNVINTTAKAINISSQK